jgi:hypothetical protein
MKSKERDENWPTKRQSQNRRASSVEALLSRSGVLTKQADCEPCVDLIVRRYARNVTWSDAAWAWAGVSNVTGSRAPIQS